MILSGTFAIHINLLITKPRDKYVQPATDRDHSQNMFPGLPAAPAWNFFIMFCSPATPPAPSQPHHILEFFSGEKL